MTGKIYQCLVNLFIGCYSAAMLLVFLSNSNEVSALQIELLVAISAALLLFRKKIPHFTTWLFLFAFVVRLTVCWFYNTEPVSDFKTMFEAAQQTIHGDFTYNQESYFLTWAYQTGFVLFEALFLKLYNSIWILKIINCFLGAGLAVLIYKISLILWEDENVAQIVSLIYAVFAFHAVHVTVLTNSHACAFFSFLGIYFLMKGSSLKKLRGGVKWNILAGICIACGNIIRPEGITFLVPILVLYIFKMFSNCNRAAVFRCIKLASAVLMAYLLVANVAAGSIKLTGVNPGGLSNRDPLWKFVLGMNYESEGKWNAGDSSLVTERQQEYGGDKRRAEWSIIKERMASSRQMADLALKKLDVFWWSPDGIHWTADYTWPKLCDTIKMIQVSEFWIMFCFSVLALFSIKKQIAKKEEILLVPFIIFTNFIVYLLIEVQARYAYLNQISVFLLGSGGMVVVKETVQQLYVKFNIQGDR